MATRNFNLYVRLHVLKTNRVTGNRYWDTNVMECRVDESFTTVPIIAEAVSKLQDQGRVDLAFEPKEKEITLLIEEIEKAQKRTRSTVTDAAFDAWTHKLAQIRKYARKVYAKTPPNVAVELVGWHRNDS